MWTWIACAALWTVAIACFLALVVDTTSGRKPLPKSRNEMQGDDGAGNVRQKSNKV